MRLHQNACPLTGTDPALFAQVLSRDDFAGVDGAEQHTRKASMTSPKEHFVVTSSSAPVKTGQPTTQLARGWVGSRAVYKSPREVWVGCGCKLGSRQEKKGLQSL